MKYLLIKEYKIISEYEISKVETAVNKMLTDNWVPSGNLIVNTPVLNKEEVAPVYTQVMIKQATQE